MVISPKIQKALNKQANAEFNAFYSYLSMSAYFESNYMPGCARWFKAQSGEEFTHAMKLNEYILVRGGQVVLTAIDAPETRWETFLSVFENAYAQELKVSELINDLVGLARSEHDYATENMLQWFVTEQVEEENAANNNVERFKLIKNDVDGIVVFDRGLGERK
jgi:ferritin